MTMPAKQVVDMVSPEFPRTKKTKHGLSIQVGALFLLIALISGIVISFEQDSRVFHGLTCIMAEDNSNPEFPMSREHNVTFDIIITDGPVGSRITAPVTIFLEPIYSENEVDLGMQLELLTIRNAPAACEIAGLGFDELREYPLTYLNSTPDYDYGITGNPQWRSFRPYAAWTEKGGFGLAVMLFPDKWDHLTLAGDVVEFENLTIYLANGQSIRCGPDIIRVAANFTRTPDGWNSTNYVEIEGSEAEVDGTQIHIDLGGAIPPSPLRCILYSGVAGGIIAALVVLWHRGKQQ
jgi:hypothetical protein